MPDFLPLVAAAGRNDLDYAAPGLPGRQIILRSARPARWTAQTPVLFVHHGVERNGADYRDYWLPLVDDADLLVVVPEFNVRFLPMASESVPLPTASVPPAVTVTLPVMVPLPARTPAF